MTLETGIPPPSGPSTPATLRPVAVSLALFGVFWGGWAVAAADIEAALALSHSQFGLLLSVALTAGAVMNAVGGALVERRGTATVLSAALAAWGCLLLVAAVIRQPIAFSALFIGIIAVGALVDVAMNVAATAQLGATPGILVRFHARFNLGAAAGAGLMGVLLANLSTWRWAWAGVGVVALLVSAMCARASLPAGGAGERVPLTGALGLLRREGLLLVAIAFAVGAMVEGGVELWGVIFLRTHLESGLLVGAGSAVAAYTVAALARILLGPAAGRRGAGRGVALGAGTAVGGILVLALAPSPLLSGVGLVLAAGGISLCWPLLIAFGSAGRARPGPVIGGFSMIGYLGFVVGPAVVGWVAGTAGLQGGLLLLAAAAVFVAAAPAISARRRARTG